MTFPEWAFELPWKDIDLCSQHPNVDRLLLAAIVMTESGGEPYATRFEPNWKYFTDPAGHAKRLGITTQTESIAQQTSFGLMQVMGGTARSLGYTELLPKLCIPNTGLNWGAIYLRHLMQKYPDSIQDAIAAYNAGSPRRGPDNKYFNQNYVNKVMAYWNELK